MNIYFSLAFRPLPAVLTALAAAALPFSVSLAQAQSPAPTAPPAAEKSVKEAVPAPYRSALEGYKNYTDEKIVNWKEANDVTARVGGWREYAKEAQQSEVMPEATPKVVDKASAPATQPLPVKP